MDWLYAQTGTFLYVSSAVLILWSLLFLYAYYALKKSNRSFLYWGMAFCILALQPAVHETVTWSEAVAALLFWFIQYFGTFFLAYGIIYDRLSARRKRLSYVVCLALSVLTLGALPFVRTDRGENIWIVAVFLLQSLASLLVIAVDRLFRRNWSNAPVYATLLLFAACQTYFSVNLLRLSAIPNYAEMYLINALLLSSSLSCIRLMQYAFNAHDTGQRLASLVENTTHGLAVVGEDGSLLQANNRMLEILGIAAEEKESLGTAAVQWLILSLAGRESREIVADFDEIRRMGLALGRSGKASLVVTVKALPASSETGGGVFLQLEDVTDARNMRGELTEKRRNMQTMYEAAGACEYTREGDLLCSERLFRALGYTMDCMTLSETAALVHPHDLDWTLWSSLVSDRNEEMSHFTEMRLRNSEDVYVWYYISYHNERKDDRIISYGLAINIDLHKRMESNMIQRDRLSAVGQLANGVAHDINNHLTTIKTAVGMLAAVSDEVQRRKYMSYIQDAVANSTGILKSLMSFSRGEEGEPIPISMNEMLMSTVGLLERALPRSVHLGYYCEAASDTVLGHYYELQNIILNLGLNARDALPEEGGEIIVKAWNADSNLLRQDADCRWYFISVTDNGCGMSAEVQKRIFDPFFTTKPQGRGNGLGLYTSWGNVQRHSGTISVDSIEGRGTEFLLAFPLVIEAADDIRLAAE